jgi:hypothetical protein
MFTGIRRTTQPLQDSRAEISQSEPGRLSTINDPKGLEIAYSFVSVFMGFGDPYRSLKLQDILFYKSPDQRSLFTSAPDP